jgi:phosphohistidine swiveling domain-containing protein
MRDVQHVSFARVDRRLTPRDGGTVDATVRLRDGQVVTVDGSAGVVEM